MFENVTSEVTLGRSKTEKEWRERIPFSNLLPKLIVAPLGQKDGTCYTPAIFRGTKRNLLDADQIGFAVLDSDCGHTLHEIVAAIDAAGYEALIHSTHSHLITQTEISCIDFEKSGLGVQAYMVKKSFLPRVVRDAQIIRTDEGGVYHVVEHEPCPKFRILIPLASPWRASAYEDQSKANLAWSAAVRALATSLGLSTDQSCSDTSRLFFLPRTRKDGPEFKYWCTEGKPCDMLEVLAAAPDELPGPNWHASDFDHDELLSWAANFGPLFEIVTALRARKPKVIIRPNGAKTAIQCPFEREHTKPGGEGCVAVNSSDLPHSGLPAIKSGFFIKCMHNACVGRDRLAFVAEMLRQEWLTDEDLTAPEFLTGATPPDNSAPDPLPLFSAIPPAEPYPVESLGPVLSRAVRAISDSVQVPAAMAAQSVLATAALAACAHVDVLMPFGQTRPISLYLAQVAESGDRKSTSDKEALWPIRKHERNLRIAYETLMKIWKTDHSVWDAEKRHILNNKNLDRPTRTLMLEALGPEPEKPLIAALLTEDPTIEGLVTNWVNMPAALGIFTTEGGVFTSGYALNDDNRIKTSAALSALWDGHPTTRLRAGDPGSILVGRRLVINIMLQPDMAAAFLSNAGLRNQGILSRIMVAKPDSLAGSRRFRERLPEETKAINAFGVRILCILETPPVFAANKRNELEPRALPLSPQATAVWKALHDNFEIQLGADGALAAIKDFANKAAENAARIAAVMTIVDNIDATEIDETTMRNAAAVIEWHVGEADRLQRSGIIDSRLQQAAALLKWLQGRQDCAATFRDILQRGPSQTRTKIAAEEALAILKSHHWIVKRTANPDTIKVIAP